VIGNKSKHFEYLDGKRVDSLIELLIYSFTQGKNLPFELRTKLCPDKKRSCKKRHGDIVVENFNKEDQSFFCSYYSVHQKKSVYSHQLSKLILKSTIKKIMKKRNSKFLLLKVKDLEKFVGKIERPINQHFRVSNEEKKILESKAKKKAISVSDYIRLELFS